MTDWLDDVLDRDIPEPVPDGFAERVVAAARLESARAASSAPAPAAEPSRGTGRLLRFPQVLAMGAAAALLLSVGFWIGQGAQPLQSEPVLGSGPDNAFLDLEEMYRHREVLEDFEILSDEGLAPVFLDEEAGTWVLDYTLEEAR